MNDPIQRRRFLQWAALGVGGAMGGSALVWTLSIPARPTQRTTASGEVLETVPRGHLPSFAYRGGSFVREMYRYAADHSADLQYIPCFCACEHIGHGDNASCYITEHLPDGRITFNSHGAM